jgi:2-amino-4-hydroxy-6-hydroxymethyldihydropteridine diphosphokinase
MKFEEWEPFYMEILDDFGFSRAKDEEAAALLSILLDGKQICDDECLKKRIETTVTVCGDAPCLAKDLDTKELFGTLIAADGATTELMRRGIVPDIIVSDLDGEIESLLEANRRGAVVMIHAHGDNIKALKMFVPRFIDLVTGTTQSRPFGIIRNFGGFTDGDRAVILARHFGASCIHLIGFDFLAPKVKKGRDLEVKLKKLSWARRLIEGSEPFPYKCQSE